MSENNMMWALVKEKPEVGIWAKRVPIPEVGYNDVKIKILKTAICGTDVHIYQWNKWAQKTIVPGLTIGHEYVGQIVISTMSSFVMLISMKLRRPASACGTAKKSPTREPFFNYA